MKAIKISFAALAIFLIVMVIADRAGRKDKEAPRNYVKEMQRIKEGVSTDSTTNAAVISRIKSQLPKKATINGWDAQSGTTIPIINIWDTCSDQLRMQKFWLLKSAKVTLIDFAIQDDQRWYKIVSEDGETGWVKKFFINEPK